MIVSLSDRQAASLAALVEAAQAAALRKDLYVQAILDAHPDIPNGVPVRLSEDGRALVVDLPPAPHVDGGPIT